MRKLLSTTLGIAASSVALVGVVATAHPAAAEAAPVRCVWTQGDGLFEATCYNGGPGAEFKAVVKCNDGIRNSAWRPHGQTVSVRCPGARLDHFKQR